MGAESTYVVQLWEDKPSAGGKRWLDIATVTVPARTKRRTIYEKALSEAGYDGTTWDRVDPLVLRCLDEDSAKETPVEPEAQPPKWKIGS